MPDRRIIAIAVTPKAYDEILKLKGKDTWTAFVLHATVKYVGGNEILEREIDALPAKKEPKPKAEKKAKEPKSKKVKKEKVVTAPSETLPEEGSPEPTEAELKELGVKQGETPDEENQPVS